VGVRALVCADSHVACRILLASGSRLALDSCARSCGGCLHRERGPLRSAALLHHGGHFSYWRPLYVALAEFHIVPLQPGRFLLVVFVVSVVACLVEFPLGRYTKKAETTH
jgi:hypothetical protein